MDGNTVQVILANLFQVVEGGLVMLVTGLASIALHKLCIKFHLGNEAELKGALDVALGKAVHAAEGWAEAKTTEPTGSEKMDVAVKMARMLLTNPTFKAFTDEQLKHLIESALSQEKDLVAVNEAIKPPVTALPVPAASIK